MLEEYTLEEPKQQDGRSPDSLIQAIDRIERLEKENKRLKTQVEIADAIIYAVLHDNFIYENADAGLIMYITRAYQKIKELEK